jgi:hypothetical protein
MTMNGLLSARAARSVRLLVPGALVAMLLLDRPAQACSLAGWTNLVLDPTEQAADRTPPSAPTVSGLRIGRGRGPERSGCGMSASSCDDMGTVIFAVSATDDRTATNALGYRITFVRGVMPPGLQLPQGDVLSGTDGTFTLFWTDGASDEQEELDFALEVRAVDRGGNVSATGTRVEVQSPGSGGCRVSRGGAHGLPSSTGALLLALLARITCRLRRRAPSR